MAKNDKPAAAKAGGQGTPSDQAPAGGGENNANQTEKSTDGHAATFNPANLQSDGSAIGDVQAGVKQGAELEHQSSVVNAPAAQPGTIAIASDHFGAMFASARIPAIEVTAHRDGYRRAGHGWGKSTQIVKLNELSDDQLEQLKTDPNIRLRGVMIDPDMDGEQA